MRINWSGLFTLCISCWLITGLVYLALGVNWWTFTLILALSFILGFVLAILGIRITDKDE